MVELEVMKLFFILSMLKEEWRYFMWFEILVMFNVVYVGV